MPLHQSPRFENIGRLLRTQYSEIANEPLPERWVDLIKYLNERERAEAERPAHETPPGVSQSPPNSKRATN